MMGVDCLYSLIRMSDQLSVIRTGTSIVVNVCRLKRTWVCYMSCKSNVLKDRLLEFFMDMFGYLNGLLDTC